MAYLYIFFDKVSLPPADIPPFNWCVSEFSPLPPWRGLPPDAWVSEGFGKERYLLRQDFLLVPLDKYGNDIDKLLLCQTILLDLHDFSCICKFVGFICGR